ncbi:hemerythrin domain-containing protein [Brevundimonas sp.]|uniref:hemerythrin domain-containing protein n=1 Tax=Brevundimonas sp. TaxID=1871086 RepID=UPI002D789BF1|nr:hemerythrin domain-containing protein [Brevundimonas sp.]
MSAASGLSNAMGNLLLPEAPRFRPAVDCPSATTVRFVDGMGTHHGEKPMRPQSRRLELIPSPDCDSLTRWGIVDCDKVDRRALADSLARLQDDESTPPPDAAGMIGRIRSRYHQVLLEIIADAVALATACERVHAADDRWPHGLSDRLMGLLEALELHQQREDAVVFPLLLSGSPQADAAVRFMAREHASIRDRLDLLSAVTCAFKAPADACMKWRVLYVLCRKIDFDIRELIGMEEHELFAPHIRDRTEAGVCSHAMFR